MAGTDQNTSPAFLTMDARKFLRAINTSAQSKVVFFEDSVKKIGQKTGRNYRLTALDANSLIFEDTDESQYYHADLGKKARGKIEISNIRPIKIVDEQKSESFDKHCLDLVESLSRDDFKSADKAFRTIEVQRFRPMVIPNNGWVTTKDGSAHRIVVEDQSQHFNIPAITDAFCEAVSEFVELDDDGRAIRGEFPETGETFSIPVNEMTRRRLVAHHMKTVAEGAWHSDSFKKLIQNVAGNVTGGQVGDAVRLTASFLKENQEFSLLTSDEVRSLVENALAAVGQFNSILAEDVSTLIHRTNLKVNKDDICEAWEKTALKAENAELLHSAKLLESAEDFATDYDKFLSNVLNEGMDVQAARAKAYLTSLKVINSIIAKMEGKEDLATQVENMVAELEEPEPSTDIILEAEQLLCSIPDTLVDRIVTLENYSEIPGSEEVMQPGETEGPEGPAVSLPAGPGGGGGGGGGPLGLGGEPGIGEGLGEGGGPGAEEEEEGGAPEEEEEEAPPLPESKQRKAATIEEMTARQLQNELDHWKTDGHIYLAEDGFDDCNRQFARYIKRCEQIDHAMLREEFEKLRDVMVETGDDVVSESDIVDDPYAGLDLGDDVQIDEEYGATMGKPSGKGVPTGGKQASSPSKGKPAAGDPKMSKPQGKGVPAKGVGQADFSGSGTGEKMDHQGGKGVQKPGVGDAGLPHENEHDPDDGKPPTGGAEMGRPDGRGVAAESAGNPEKVKPGTGKQYKGGGWVDKLDEKLAGELKSGDQGDKLSGVSPKVKGGVGGKKGKKTVAEGEVPEAFKKQWNKKKDDGDDEECETPGEKKRSDGEGKGMAKGKGKGPIGIPTSEDIATILRPFMEGKDLTPKAIAGAILKLKEEAKTKPELQKSIKILEAYDFPRGGSQRLQCDFCDDYFYGEDSDPCPGCGQGRLAPMGSASVTSDEIDDPIISDVLLGISDATGADVMDLEMDLKTNPYEFVEAHAEFINPEDRSLVLAYGEEGFAMPEAQYKGAAKGMRPLGFKKSSINEWTDEELSVFLETLAEAEEWDPFEAAKKRAEIKKMAARKKAKKEAGKGIAGLSRKEELADADRELDAAMKAGAEEADEAGLCTCAYPRKSATSSNCRKCGKPMKAQESFFNTENVEILRSAIYESTTPDAPEAKDQRLKIARCIGEAHKKLQTNLQEAALAVFADDESIDKVIDSIVGAMADQGMDMTPAGAIDTMVGDIDAGEEGSEGLPELPMPGTPDVPDEGPGEGPEEGEGPPESFQFGAEEEEDEEGGEEEETEEEEEEITED